MKVTSASKLRPMASAPARRQGSARKARGLTARLTATGATALQVFKQLLDAAASLIHHRLKHEITESAARQRIAQVVFANVDGEPVGAAYSKPPAPLGLASPLKRLGEDARKSIKAGQLLLPVCALGRIYGRHRFDSFSDWDDFALGASFPAGHTHHVPVISGNDYDGYKLDLVKRGTSLSSLRRGVEDVVGGNQTIAKRKGKCHRWWYGSPRS